MSRPNARARGPAAAPVHPGTAALSATAALGVAAVTFVAFLPTLGSDFLAWDDAPNFVNNAHYRGLGFTQLGWMWTTFHLGHWIPLTWMTLGLDYLVWGMNPAGYHFTSLVLHAGAAVACYFVAARLLRAAIARPAEPWRVAVGAVTAALIFAVHPLRVESVAWATERRDVLSGLLYLVTILAYLRATSAAAGTRPRLVWYWTAVAAFALSMLAKSITVTLPLTLLVLDVYPLRRLSGRVRAVLLEKLPFAALAAAGAVVAVIAQRKGAGFTAFETLRATQRLAVAVYASAFYLWTTAAPVHLAPMYEMPLRLDPLAWPFLVSAAACVAITAVAVVLRRRYPALAAAWLVYLVTLLPVSGLLHVGTHIAADRYTYMPCLPSALLAGGAVLLGVRSRSAGAVVAAAGVAVAVLAVLTWQYTEAWRDTRTLWTYASRVAPSPTAYANLADALLEGGASRDAAEFAERAIRLKPSHALAHNTLGLARVALGDRPGAIIAFREASRVRPAWSVPLNNMGVVLDMDGRSSEATTYFLEALRLSPDYADASRNLTEMLTRRPPRR